MEHDWIKIAALPLVGIAAASPVFAAEYMTVEQAQKIMFGRSAQFERADLSLDGAARNAIKVASKVQVERDVLPVWKVFRDGEPSGYFVVDEVIGKHQFITYAIALDKDGTVLQIEILVYRESYGYEIRNPAWRAQFKGRKPGKVFGLGDEIKNISGATLSCRHITEGVNRVLATYDLFLRDH